MATTNALLCPFLNQDPAYALGVEFGLLWGLMQDEVTAELEGYFTRANQDQILLACNRLGWRAAEMKPHDEGWMWYRLERNEAP